MIRSNLLSVDAVLELTDNSNTSECNFVGVSKDEDFSNVDSLKVHNDIEIDIDELLEADDK